MVFAVFLVRVLGVSMASVGLIEGVAESCELPLIKIFLGALSDRTGRRKPLLVFGYALSATVRYSVFPCRRGINGTRCPRDRSARQWHLRIRLPSTPCPADPGGPAAGALTTGCWCAQHFSQVAGEVGEARGRWDRTQITKAQRLGPVQLD